MQTDAGATADAHYVSASEGQSASAESDGSGINPEQAERFEIRVGPKGIEDVFTQSTVIVDSIPIPGLDHIRVLSSNTFSEPWEARFAGAVATVYILRKKRFSRFRPSDQFLHTAQNYEVHVWNGIYLRLNGYSLESDGSSFDSFPSQLKRNPADPYCKRWDKLSKHQASTSDDQITPLHMASP